jgi:glycosyltransferase involved in cell wall biosynthesis
MKALAPILAELQDVPAPGRLRVAVLVDLVLAADAGGHVKCWERLARAALDFSDRLDLTIYFIGAERELRIIGENVRYVLEPPFLSTARLPFLSHVPDHTDLAPLHPRLARLLHSYDVIHTTDAYFAYARTAQRFAARRRVPLVTSVHTNTPNYARIYAEQTVERVFGRGTLARLILDSFGLARFAEQHMRRRLADHQRACAAVLVSRPDELDAVSGPRRHAGILRRGVDRNFFQPAKRDKAWLARRFDIPPDAFTVLYAGRVSQGKNVMLLADAMAELVAQDMPVHLICAGDGAQLPAIAERLGRQTSLPGNVPPEMLSRLYASADLFAFPSPVEECANVVLEALASGLPVLVAQEGGMERFLQHDESGFVLPNADPAAWARCIAALAGNAQRRDTMARAARRYAERRLPSWGEVLAEDLLPRWRMAATRR